MGLHKQDRRFEEHNFSVWRRYYVTGNYPEPKHGKWHKQGDIIEIHNESKVIGEDFYIDNPSIFKLLNWWEKRTFEEMFSIRYLQMNASQYFIPGDILEVDGFKITENTLDVEFKGFQVMSQILKPCDVLPLRIYKQYDRIHTKEIRQTNSV